MPHLRRPSPAMCVALVGLFVALGGTTWAAVSLPAGSVGTAQLKQDAVTGNKVKNHTLTGADINTLLLGTVPSARKAALAAVATNALKADTAGHATSADSANVAYSTHFETGIPLPGSPPGVPGTPVTVASLHVPAGSYVLMAKGQIDSFSTKAIVGCDLVAESDKDSSFVQGGADDHQSLIITNSLVHRFAAAGTVNLVCTGFLDPATLSQVRLTAMTVGSIAG
jgi:hypothetical protein